MAKFQKMETSDYLDIMKEFECVKRDFGTTKDEFILRLPAFLVEACKRQLEQSVNWRIS